MHCTGHGTQYRVGYAYLYYPGRGKKDDPTGTLNPESSDRYSTAMSEVAGKKMTPLGLEPRIILHVDLLPVFHSHVRGRRKKDDPTGT